MDSDKRWYDVEFTISGIMRTEGYDQNDAWLRVHRNLDFVEFNPGGWDDRELVRGPEVSMGRVEFVPQGYRQQDAPIGQDLGGEPGV